MLPVKEELIMTSGGSHKIISRAIQQLGTVSAAEGSFRCFPRAGYAVWWRITMAC